MISGGDFAVFLLAVAIVITFFVILRHFLVRAERDSDAHADGRGQPKH